MAPVVYVAAMAAKAIGTYQQGQTQKKLYNLQAQQEQIKGERDKLRYEDAANDVMNKLNATNATISARAASGGVSYFEGSARMLSAVSNKYAGKDFTRAMESGKMAQSMGEAQAGVLRATGEQAAKSATLSMITDLAMAGASMYTMGTTPTAGPGSPRSEFSGTTFMNAAIPLPPFLGGR
jgi:hypothetical protein